MASSVGDSTRWHGPSERSPLIDDRSPDGLLKHTEGLRAFYKRAMFAAACWICSSLITVLGARWLCMSNVALLFPGNSSPRFDVKSSKYSPSHDQTPTLDGTSHFTPTKAQVARGKEGFPSFWNYGGMPIDVAYDSRSILLNGKRVLFLGGSMHPSRATRQSWESALDEAVHQGLNLITMYVIWAEHQPVKERPLDWTLRQSITCQVHASNIACTWELSDAIRAAANRGLFVHIRVGPYVCAEYTYGGIPDWLPLHYPGTSMRRPTEQWMTVMEEFVTQATSYLIDHGLFSYQGGPIILAQIENEIGQDETTMETVETSKNRPKSNREVQNTTLQDYADWCGALAQRLVPHVVWTMCSGLSASNTICTYNGFFDDVGWLDRYGESGRIQVDQPALWTEVEGGFQIWGEEPSHPIDYVWGKTAQSMSLAILRWFARGGTHVNYYMWWGGYNRGRSAAAGIMNVYASDAPLCPSGQRHHPKFDHLQQLHSLLQDIAPTLLYSRNPVNKGELLLIQTIGGDWVLGDNQRKFTFNSSDGKRTVLFAENMSNTTQVVLVQQGNIVEMTAYSSLLLVDGVVRFDSSEVIQSAKAFQRTFERVPDTLRDWVSWFEPIGASAAIASTQIGHGPIEQTMLNVGAGVYSDYAWFGTEVAMAEDEDGAVLYIETQEANSLVVFVDGAFVGESNSHFRFDRNVTLSVNVGRIGRGKHVISFLSESLGFSNLIGRWGASTLRKVKGITGSVILSFGGQNVTLTDGRPWMSFPGLHGERASNGWNRTTGAKRQRSISSVTPVWSSAMFRTPLYDPTSQSLFLDTTQGRGHFWLNGHDLGRYWNITRGLTSVYSQRYYSLPFDLLQPRDGWNELVIFDVFGGDNNDKRIAFSSIKPSDSETFEDEVDFNLSCL